MIEQTLGENEHGEPVVVITVTGWHDIFRLQFNFAHAQIEFGKRARLCFVWMRKRVGVKRFEAMDKSLTGGKVVKTGWHKTIEEEYR